MNAADFLEWEKKAYGVDFKVEYVDVADGDIEAGLLLSQLIFWYLPAKNGKSKLRVQFDGLFWIAKKRGDWWKETRLNQKRFDRAIRILEECRVVRFETRHFNHVPMLHVALLPAFFDRLQEVLDEPPKP